MISTLLDDAAFDSRSLPESLFFLPLRLTRIFLTVRRCLPPSSNISPCHSAPPPYTIRSFIFFSLHGFICLPLSLSVFSDAFAPFFLKPSTYIGYLSSPPHSLSLSLFSRFLFFFFFFHRLLFLLMLRVTCLFYGYSRVTNVFPSPLTGRC
ncbi:hypothetical protein M413DRAFT_376922 [Hebeloma cylindrosporum]|uniref:Transmembrane protein n=1 Tax=Hebeloma cylindrosporum TaxID=76867 RepID=A0A0C2YT95_HEBCY|nr:hypothetical protein M413DRAFT_376922 [Hebeloma cylindrosporum h7]